MQTKRKIQKMIFACVLTLSLAVSNGEMANSQTDYVSEVVSNITVCSAEYPDAFIKTEKQSISRTDQKIVQVIEATAFVEDSYEYINGKPTITESRLLSESEVREIGEDSFVGTSYGLRSTTHYTPVTNSRAKLDITFYLEYTTQGTGITVSCEGIAKWNAPGFIALPVNNPAGGEDFFGFAWYGDYSINNYSCELTWNYGLAPEMLTSYYSEPNTAFVYAFNEAMDLGPTTLYAKQLDFNLTLQKNVLTGSGNGADIVMQYIHTYQAINGAINLSLYDSGVTLNGVSKQWTLSCLLSDVPY